MAGTADVFVSNEGSLVLFTVETESARTWVGDNVQVEGYQWLGARSFAVDRRYAEDLMTGMVEDGLEVQA